MIIHKYSTPGGIAFAKTALLRDVPQGDSRVLTSFVMSTLDECTDEYDDA
jgi:hypothetical protein